MKILLLCDRQSAKNTLAEMANSLLLQAGHTVDVVTLNHDELTPCIGCFGCWLRTPGQCLVTNDEANSIAEREIHADAVVLLSAITYGGFSSDTKAFLDRSVQNILPHFEMFKGEMHHKKRYKRFPDWIAIGYGHASDAERQVFIRLAERNALNMRPDKFLAVTVRDGAELAEKGQSICTMLEADEWKSLR